MGKGQNFEIGHKLPAKHARTTSGGHHADRCIIKNLMSNWTINKHLYDPKGRLEVCYEKLFQFSG